MLQRNLKLIQSVPSIASYVHTKDKDRTYRLIVAVH